MDTQQVTLAGLQMLLGQRTWLADEYSLPSVAEDLWRRWNEPHRCWHGPGHLKTLLAQAASASDSIRFRLVLAIVFHDAIYDPRRRDNERASANLFRKWASMLSPDDVEEIARAIEDTATGVPRNGLAEVLIKMDRRILSSSDWSELLEWERDIAREYQHVSWPEYVKGRGDFLEKNGLPNLAGYVKNRRPNIGLYAGSFDPFHQGHFNILSKAEHVFDKVVVAVGINPEKPTSAVESRLTKVRHALPFHEVIAFSGLLTSLVGGNFSLCGCDSRAGIEGWL